MDEDHDDVHEVTSFFKRRAKFTPKLSAEGLQTASKLLEKIQEERNKGGKACKRKASVMDNCDSPEKSIVEDNIQSAPSGSSIALSPVALSPDAKKRLQKFRRQSMAELKRIEKANNEVLSSLNKSSINDVDDKYEDEDIDSFEIEKRLTIMYFSEVLRLNYSEDEKFAAIFSRIADYFKLNLSEFLLCRKDRNIHVDDTPKSLNIVSSDLLECIPFKPEMMTDTESDVDMLKLFFQTRDEREKIEMAVHKLEKMQDVMERYSKIRNIPLEQMVFEFDAEQISGTETPLDMDMESGICIDVNILTSGNKI